jgi:hypothetical protein
MTSKEKAELLFKKERLSGSRSSTPEYEQRARAERTKTARLRALRLAREAELAFRPEEAGMVTEKLAKLKSPKTSGRHAAFANAPVPEAGGERPAELDQSRLMISKSKTIIAVVLRAESESNPGR